MTFERLSADLPSGPLPYLVAGAGEPLLYLHAAGGPLETDFLKALAAYRRIYMPILPGFNGTPKLAGVETVEDLASLAADFGAQVIGGPSDVMGASFGGWIALWLAARFPERVGELVLEGPAGLRFGMDASSLTPEAARANLFAYPDKAAGVLPPRETAMANGAAFAAYSRGLFVDEALVAALPTIAARTLVLMGTLDVTVPQETGWTLAARLPLVNVSYVYDAAHAIEVDQPAACLRLVRHFLDKGPAFLVAAREYAL